MQTSAESVDLLTVDYLHRVWTIPKSAIVFCKHSSIRIPYETFREFLWHRRAVSDLFRTAVHADEVVLVRVGSPDERLILWGSILTTRPRGVFASHGELGGRFLVFWPLAKALNAYLMRRDRLLPQPPAHPIDVEAPCIEYSSTTTLSLGPVDIPGATLTDPDTLTAAERLYASMIHAANMHGQRTTTSSEVDMRRARSLLRTQTVVDPRHSLLFQKATVDRVSALKRDRDTTTSHFQPQPAWPQRGSGGDSAQQRERRQKLLRRVLGSGVGAFEDESPSVRGVVLPDDILTRIVCTAMLSAISNTRTFSNVVLLLRSTSKALKHTCESFLAIQLHEAGLALDAALSGASPPYRAARAAQRLGLLLDDVAFLNAHENLVTIDRGPSTLPLCKEMRVPSWKLYCKTRLANGRRYRANTTMLVPTTKPSEAYAKVMKSLSTARGTEEPVHEGVGSHLDSVMMQKAHSFDTMLNAAGLL